MALSIICKLNEEPTVTRTHSNHSPAGTYKEVANDNTTAIVTITGGGCNIKGKAPCLDTSNTQKQQDYEITITKWYSGDSSTAKGSFVLDNQGEANITSPANCTSFSVSYYPGNKININFRYQNNNYGVILDKQS